MSFCLSFVLPCVWCSNTVIVREYEKVVVFRLGRVQGAKARHEQAFCCVSLLTPRAIVGTWAHLCAMDNPTNALR